MSRDGAADFWAQLYRLRMQTSENASFAGWNTSLTIKMPGSTMKTCISCMQHIRVACKICKLCGAQQQMKKAVEKAKGKADREWGAKLKKGGNLNKLMNAARVLVHKLKMAGLHPMLLFGREKKGSVTADSISGLELVSDTNYKSLKIIEGLYGSLVTVIVKRERANPLTPVDPEGPRELAESPLHPEATEEEGEEGEEGEEEETFDLLLTPCDPAPTAPATAPSTSHSPPGPSSPPSSPPLSNSKESCPPKHPDPAPIAPATAPSTSYSPPGPSSPTSSPLLSNCKESCPAKHPRTRKGGSVIQHI
ncbi:uncharacterized protein LOC133958558 [Platichthys flesus]|uniref:uncharacterized protein LOC133958558 n=1 Tax=Platichthys flesus TaxID=8260 RepID=UPI002DB98A6E|nr:uncharacterized protein LOC133958558 [Platichthys flesus]